MEGTLSTTTGAGLLTIHLVAKGGRRDLALVGELDLASAATLDVQLRDAEAHGDAISVDLRRLEFIDAAGVRVLLEAQDRWSSAGIGGEVVGAQGEVQRLLMHVGATLG